MAQQRTHVALKDKKNWDANPARRPTSVAEVALSLAASPCPNDTFVFHALVHGLIPGAPEVDLTFADVDVTAVIFHVPFCFS